VEYQTVRAYLNIHELVAVGVNTGVLDNKVCYEFWSDELMDAFQSGKPLIEHIRKLGSPLSYCDLEKLNKKWVEQDKKDKEARERISPPQFGLKLTIHLL
jgi:hypothetical protein